MAGKRGDIWKEGREEREGEREREHRAGQPSGGRPGLRERTPGHVHRPVLKELDDTGRHIDLSGTGWIMVV